MPQRNGGLTGGDGTDGPLLPSGATGPALTCLDQVDGQRGEALITQAFRTTQSRRFTVVLVVVSAALFLFWWGAAPASADQTLTSGNYPNGFEVPAGETWTFDPNSDTTITSGGNVIVRGTLVMKPANGNVDHVLRFTGVNEASFVGGGMDPVASDVGLWVVGAGRLIIEGEEKVAWDRQYHASWAGDEVIAAPNSPGDYDGFRAVTSTPPANALGYRTELLNLTRNVRIEGTPQGYTHVFIRSSRPSTIRYATLRYVAPNPASFSPGTDSTGRYGIHIHMSGNGSRGTLVEGVVIRDARNHAFVPHGSHGVTFRDTIAYNVWSEAYWWDDPAPGQMNETDDVVFDRVVAANLRGAPGGNHHRLTAFYLGAGGNPVIRNSVAVGVQSEDGADRSGFLWPESSEGSWTYENNIAHNNEGHGIFVWQNNSMRHVIDGFTAYYNENSGIEHGAYQNSYVYRNLTLLDNGRAITSLALGEPGDGTDTQRWGNIRTDSGTLVIGEHVLEAESPVVFADCDFSEVVVADDDGEAPSIYDFIRCGLEPSDFDLRSARPDSVFRVQRANGTAYRLTGTGSVTSIPAFAPLSPPDYGQGSDEAGGDSFVDDDGSIFESDIEWLAGQGITRGCNPPQNDRFCPDDFVTRGQMAAFLVRALGYTDPGRGNYFTDDDGNIFENDIDRLRHADVTRGCNPPQNDRFCPDDFVTRGQMAAFLVRALGYTDPGRGNYFTDDDGNIFENDIDRLRHADVTRGCNPPQNDRFCPDDFVTRGQMAAFLRRALSG